MRRAFIGAGVLFAVCANACQPRLEQTWQLTDFRVLGVKVDPPEPDRGANVMATLSWADVRDRSVSVLWLTCAVSVDSAGLAGGGGGGDAGTSANGLSGCTVVTPPGAPFPIPDMGTTVTVHIPDMGGARDASNREVITLFGFACAGGTIGAPEDGGTQPECRGTGARGWSFTRTIRIHDPMSQDAPNTNQRIREVRFGMAGSTMPITNDAPPTIPICRDQSSNSMCPQYVFEVAYEDGSRETFHAADPNDGGAIVTRQERLTTGYVITAGELGGAFRTDTAENPMANMQVTYRAPETAGDVHLVVYSADGRGGYDATDRHILVQ